MLMILCSSAMPATWWLRMVILDNNAAVRRILLERGVVPEDLPAEEDVKKVERRLASEKKKAIENKRK